MTNTASKLAASVQRAKSQPAANKTEDVAAPVVSTPEVAPQPETQQRPARTSRASSKAKTATNAKVTAEQVSIGNGDHNGGQPNFPNRVWPD